MTGSYRAGVSKALTVFTAVVESGNQRGTISPPAEPVGNLFGLQISGCGLHHQVERVVVAERHRSSAAAFSSIVG